MAAGLEPPLQLPMMEQQDPVPALRDHDRAAREVALGDPAVEGIGVAAHEVEDPPQVRGLEGVGGDVAGQVLGQGGAGHAGL